MDQTSKCYKVLTPDDVSHFMKHGYIVLKECFSRAASDDWTCDVWTRLGMSPMDKTTWTRERTNMPGHRQISVPSFAPKAWDAICDLVGGEERVTSESKMWNDSFIVNLGTPEYEGKETGPKQLDEWHVDGDFFVHFLDSPEQGLLVIPMFTDIEPNGGGTWICDEGPARIGKWLYDHPEGVGPRMTPADKPDDTTLSFFNNTIQNCSPDSFHEMTGNVGDVVLLHPLMLHSASKNGRRLARIITNPPVSLKEPFNFDRPNREYSLVELKTIQDVGGQDKLKGWKITGPRAAVVPERLRIQAKWLAEENERLRRQGVEYNGRMQDSASHAATDSEADRLQGVAVA